MRDRMYLLSIEELLEENISEDLKERCMKLVDAERMKRIQAAKSNIRLAENIGAGLLVQLAVREMCEQAAQVVNEKERNAQERNVPKRELENGCNRNRYIKITLKELLDLLEKYDTMPLPLEYIYTEKGKPFLKGYPYYFNLSHSGTSVFCVISTQEVGADIQLRKPLTEERIVNRFFTEEEKDFWENCASTEEKRHYFYRLWTRKEAYGKLTGEGIGAVIGRDIDGCNRIGATKEANAVATVGNHQRVVYEEYEVDDYQIAVCKWR